MLSYTHKKTQVMDGLYGTLALSELMMFFKYIVNAHKVQYSPLTI